VNYGLVIYVFLSGAMYGMVGWELTRDDRVRIWFRVLTAFGWPLMLVWSIFLGFATLPTDQMRMPFRAIAYALRFEWTARHKAWVAHARLGGLFGPPEPWTRAWYTASLKVDKGDHLNIWVPKPGEILPSLQRFAAFARDSLRFRKPKRRARFADLCDSCQHPHHLHGPPTFAAQHGGACRDDDLLRKTKYLPGRALQSSPCACVRFVFPSSSSVPGARG
jgi:hypothetical protein